MSIRRMTRDGFQVTAPLAYGVGRRNIRATSDRQASLYEKWGDVQTPYIFLLGPDESVAIVRAGDYAVR